MIDVAAPVALLAGWGVTGVSGGSGTKLVFSMTPAELFHFRSNMSVNHWNMFASVQKQLCSSCPLSDGLVQFDEPKIDIA